MSWIRLEKVGFQYHSLRQRHSYPVLSLVIVRPKAASRGIFSIGLWTHIRLPRGPNRSLRPFFSVALYFCPRVRFCGALNLLGFSKIDIDQFRRALPRASASPKRST